MTLVLGLSSLQGVFAAQGDYTPARSGLTHSSHPYGLADNDFNRYTDSTYLSDTRSRSGESSYMDERDFSVVKKGTTPGDPYHHTLPDTINVGDTVRVYLWAHNNAEEFRPPRFAARNVVASTDFSNPNSLLSTISASNTIHNPVTDIASVPNTSGPIEWEFVRAAFIEYIPSAGHYVVEQNIPPSDPRITLGGSSVSFNLEEVNGSTSYVQRVFFDLRAVDGSNPDFSLTKSASPASGTSVGLSGTIEYTITAQNTGNVALPAGTGTDTLDSNLTFVSGDSGVSHSGGVVTLSFPSLNPGQSVSRTFIVQVDASAADGTNICNTASATLSGIARTSNQVCHTVDTSIGSSFTITKTSDPADGSNVSRDQTIVYGISVTNTGSVATAPIVTDVLDSNVTFASNRGDPDITYNGSTRTVTLAFASLAPGETARKLFNVTVNSGVATGTDICNQATGSGGTPVSNQVCHTVADDPGLLAFTKAAVPTDGTTVSIGDTIEYTISVTNNDATNDATNVIVTDMIDPRLTFASNGGDSDITTSTDAGGFTIVNLNFGTVVAGATDSKTFTVTVNAGAGEEVCNLGNGRGDIAGVENRGSTDLVCHPVDDGDDFVTDKVSDPQSLDENPTGTVSRGQTIVYALSVTAPAGADLTNVITTDTLESGLDFASNRGDPDITYNATTREVTVDFGTVAAGTQAIKLFNVTVNNTVLDGEQVCNDATTTADGGLTSTAGEICHLVEGDIDPNFSIVKSADPVDGSIVAIGETFEYTLAVTNNGTTSLDNIVISDLLDPRLDFVSNLGDGTITTTEVNGIERVFINIASLAVGASSSHTFEVQLNTTANTGETFCNIANGTGERSGTTVNNSSNQICHEVGGVLGPNLEIIKSGTVGGLTIPDVSTLPENRPTGGAGTEVIYTLSIENIGTDPLTNVVITDALNLNMTFVSGGIGVAASGNDVTITVGDMAVGEVFTTTISATMNTGVTNGLLICNQATGSATETTSNVNSNQICFQTPSDGGGGGGGGASTPTIGACQTNTSTGAYSCVERYPNPDPDDPLYVAYNDCVNNSLNTVASCLQAWADAQEIDVCGPVDAVTGDIYVPVPGGYDLTTLDPNQLATQCAPRLASTSSCSPAGCPTCFGTTSNINKEVVGDTTVRNGDTVRYRITLDTGVYMNPTQQSIIPYIGDPANQARVRFYDNIDSDGSGRVYNRQGVVTTGWQFDPIAGVSYVDYYLDATEVAELNAGNSITIDLEYDVDTNLEVDTDASSIHNTVWAIMRFNYLNLDPLCTTGCTGTRNIGFGQGVCSTNTYSFGSYGASAFLNLVRPYVGTRGGDIAIQYDDDQSERLIADRENVVGAGSPNTSGSVIVEDADATARPGLFGFGASVVRMVNDFTDIKQFQGDVGRDDFFTNLKQNATVTQTVFGTPFITTPSDGGVYFLESGDVTLSDYDAGGSSKTFIIESGNLIIDGDVEITNGFAAFIVRNGNILIHKDVADLQGMFLVENGQILSKNNQESDIQLNVSGALMGDTSQLVVNRTFIGVAPEVEVEPNIQVFFDMRMLTDTPPGIEQFLGEDWKEDIESMF